MRDELCALTGWTRRHARRALARAIAPSQLHPGRPGPGSIYWSGSARAAAGDLGHVERSGRQASAPYMPQIVEALARCGEIRIEPEVRAKLLRVSAATIDRVLAPERARLQVRGRSGTKPGSLLKPRSPSGPSPSGTMLDPGSARSTWWPVCCRPF